MKNVLIIFLNTIICFNAFAQNDPEFPKEFTLHLKYTNGLTTNFKTTLPDLYVGGLQLVPQYTIVPHLIRAGFIANILYTNKKLQGAFGPTASIKLKTLWAKPYGSAGNINLNIDYLWGTQHQRLLGGGLNADLANKIILGFTIHRDDVFNTWWLQNSLAIRLNKVKKIKEPFN